MTREEAIFHMILRREELKHSVSDLDEDIKAFDMAVKALEQQPCEDAVSRQAVLDIYDDYNVAVENGELEAYRKHRKRLLKLPSVQPKYNASEWCHDCKEYDQDKHCCPRFNKVIRNAVKEVKQPRTGHWIPVSERLPERSGEYLVSVIDGSEEDNDYEAVGVAWFAHKKDYDIKESEWRELRIDETVIAWLPLPEPYEPQESEG